MSKSNSATPYIIEVSQQAQLAMDETLLEGCVEVTQKSLSPFEEQRGVDIEQYSDGSVKASSFKAYNLLFFSQNKFQVSLMKDTAMKTNRRTIAFRKLLLRVANSRSSRGSASRGSSFGFNPLDVQTRK